MYDLAFSSGDLVPNGSGGLLLVYDLTVDMQDIAYRAQTNNPDQVLHPLGANLEDCIGLPNNQVTGDRARKQLLNALTYDGRFRIQDLRVAATPISSQQIELAVTVSNTIIPASSAVYTTILDLEG
jgi:hypothetical protein